MFTNAYAEESYELEYLRTTTKRLRVLLYSRYEKVDLYKVMETQCLHLTITQRNELLELSQKFEELFDGILGIWKTDPVGSKLKEYMNPICSRIYPLPNVHEEMFKEEFGRLVLLGVLEVANYS